MATPGNIQNIQLLDYNANPITPITYLNSISDQIGEVTLTGMDVFNQWLAPLLDASLMGHPLTPTPSTSSNDKSIANTEYVRNAIEQYSVTPTSYATVDTYGIVRIGTGINVNNGNISLSIASNSSLGGVKIGNNLYIESDGKLNVTIPIASNSSLGGVKIGNNLYIESDGKLNVTIPKASSSVYGGIKVNTKSDDSYNVEVKMDSETGFLYVPSYPTVSIPIATSTQVGGVKSGGDVSINSSTGSVSVKSITSINNDVTYKLWIGTLEQFNLIEQKDPNTIYYVDELL